MSAITRGLTDAGWVWYTLENGDVQLDDLSAEETHQLQAEQLIRKAVSKLMHVKSGAAFAGNTLAVVTTDAPPCQAVICHMQRSLLAGAWQSWCEFTEVVYTIEVDYQQGVDEAVAT